MSGKFTYITSLFMVISVVCGCRHHAAFPGVEGSEGTLSADEQNVSYDDSTQQEVTVIAQIPEEEQISSAQTPISVDLTVPSSEVEDITENTIYTVPSKTTPVVIADMDLKEMDGYQTKIVKPIRQQKVIIPVKTRTVIHPQTAKAPEAQASVYYLAETIYFNDGGSAVNPEYAASLRRIVKEAEAHNGKVIVQGFASSRTRNTDVMTHKMANLKVSVARAENVADALIKYGMPKSRVITEGLSDSRPLYKEVMPEGERLNRRAEIYISY